MGMGNHKISVRWFCWKCKEPTGKPPPFEKNRRDHKKGLSFTAMVFLFFYWHPQLRIFNKCEVLGARPLNIFVSPSLMVLVHHVLTCKCYQLRETVLQISSKAAWREKHLSLPMGELGPITITCYCLPEDYETWLHCCQYLPAWKYHSCIWHGALRSPRICFSLEAGNCSQRYIPAGQATLKHASTHLSPCQVMSWTAICNAASPAFSVLFLP